VTFVPPGDPATGLSGPGTDPWAGLREDLAADVRRVSDRLRSLSATRLAGPPGPSAAGGPPFVSRAQAGRAAAAELARAAAALEAAAGPGGQADRDVPEQPELPEPPEPPELPELSDLAVGDQVAVTGHDLLGALDLVGPGVPVWTGTYQSPPAEQAVRDAAGRPVPADQLVGAAWELLRDVRRRL
jgi:hypothetical protein